MASNTSNNQQATNRDSSVKKSYEGKTVYVGIDVHKKTYSVVTIVDNLVVKKWRTEANPENLAQQLLRYYSGAEIQTAYEAGFSGFVLHRVLEKAGINNIVVNPASIEIAANSRVKTDKRDAHKLATMLASGRLTGIRIPPVEQEQRRLLTRTRQQLVEERTAIKCKVWMKFHQMGLVDPQETREISHNLMAELIKLSPSTEFTLVMDALWQVWKTIDAQIKKIESELKKQGTVDPNEKVYRSTPGIGPIAARILSNELGNLNQFNNERQLFSYTGLTPSEFSSGDKIRRGNITRQGNVRVRHILTEAAWRAIGKDISLKNFFERLYPRTGKKKAIVAVARKLIGRIRAAFRFGTTYKMVSVSEENS